MKGVGSGIFVVHLGAGKITANGNDLLQLMDKCCAASQRMIYNKTTINLDVTCEVVKILEVTMIDMRYF